MSLCIFQSETEALHKNGVVFVPETIVSASSNVLTFRELVLVISSSWPFQHVSDRQIEQTSVVEAETTDNEGSLQMELICKRTITLVGENPRSQRYWSKAIQCVHKSLNTLEGETH